MNYLGSIGYVMKNSGILELFSIIYPELSVKFWHILSIRMVDLLPMNLITERSESWDMYIYLLSCMLPYFARKDHDNYDRSSYWFLQEMSLYPQWISMIICRMEYLLSGVSPDLCIEQTLMASIKRSSGLTREGSLIDVKGLIWALSCSDILSFDMKIKALSGVRFWSSEQQMDVKQVHSTWLQCNTDDMGQSAKFCKCRYLLEVDAVSKVDKKLKRNSCRFG